MSVIETNIEIPADYSVSVFGQFDEYVKKIEKTLKVTIIARDSQVKFLEVNPVPVMHERYWQIFWNLPNGEIQ